MKEKFFLINLLVLILFAGSVYTEGIRDATISSYTTSVSGQEPPVKTNIKIASSKLNGVEIPPGAVFSFNETVGEGSAANGYLNGRVLYQDRAAYEAGGGICQVSSTLFNALLLAGCTIIERHRHAYPVTYVPLGLDATIRYGKKDLRVRNPHPRSIFISTSMNDTSLLIAVKAERELPASYEVFTEEESMNIPFDENPGRRIRPGTNIYVYRKKIVNGNPAETALLYRDFYPPVYID